MAIEDVLKIKVKGIWTFKSVLFSKTLLVRKKGNKDYSLREKQMMVSLINDYTLFGATDDEMIQMLSIKLGKENNQKISETLFYTKVSKVNYI